MKFIKRGVEMKTEYSVGRKIGKVLEDLKRISDSDYDFKQPILYVRRKENLVIMAESEYKNLKEMERIDTCLKLATGSSVSCFNYKDKTIACMSIEKYNKLLSKALKDKEDK